VTVQWTEDGGNIRTEQATLEDISPAGACLHLEHAIPAEAKVVLRHPKGKYIGEVRYCESQEIGYVLGIAFGPKSRWTRLEFQPSHLLQHSHA